MRFGGLYRHPHRAYSVILAPHLGSILVLTPVLQTLSVRLGSVTSSSLPQQTRTQILRLKEKHPKYRVALHTLLWVLYILAEVAIIGTDLAELLGTAIALNL